MTVFTIGHSVHPLDEFVALLEAHAITQLADVRTVPKSRRHPHFVREALQASLPERGVAYRHFPGLGGLRKPRRDSRNTAWRVEGFRGYADYMETAEFERSLDALVAWANELGDGSGDPERVALHDARQVALHEGPQVALHGEPQVALPGGPNVARPFQGREYTAIMCAEAVWWKCHRQLIADALVARGIEVRHIATKSSAPVHTLTDFARLTDQSVSYPGLSLVEDGDVC